MADMIPIAKTGDTTAYHATVGQLTGASGVMALSTNAAVGATSVNLRSVPDYVSGYGGYLIIDPGSVECEVRNQTTFAANVASFATPLTYAHAVDANVLWTPFGEIYAKWFAAQGDDSSNDYTPLARALVQANIMGAGVVRLSRGTYRIGTGLILGDGVSLIGEGQYNTVIKATSGITMLTVDTGDSAGGGFRYSRVSALRLEGNSLATIGIATGKAVLAHFSDLNIRYCTGAGGYGVQMDRSQNQSWDNILSEYNNVNLRICNGAANNSFVNFHGASPNTCGVHILTDIALPGYIVAGTNEGNQNCFVRCLFERLTPTNGQVYIENGHRNTFYCCDFERDTTSTVPLIIITSDANLNHFRDCRINSSSATSIEMVTVAGDDTVFDNCHFTDLDGATDIIQVSDGWIRFRGEFPALGSINVTAGNIYGRVREFVCEQQSGPTAERPTPGDVLGCWYFDTTLNKPVWYDPSSATDWRDATGAAA